MAKSTEKKTKGAKTAKTAKKAKKITKSRTKASEYVDCLLELHKLQGVLLTRLDKEV